MDNVILDSIVAAGATFGDNLLNVRVLDNGDFTEATMPDETRGVICGREDARGTNPLTGVDTRASLGCQ